VPVRSRVWVAQAELIRNLATPERRVVSDLQLRVEPQGNLDIHSAQSVVQAEPSVSRAARELRAVHTMETYSPRLQLREAVVPRAPRLCQTVKLCIGFRAEQHRTSWAL